MGLLKDLQIEAEDRGWWALSDRFVCDRCIGEDYALEACVRDNVEALRCSYCDSRSKRPIAAPLDKIMAVIARGVFSEFGHPDNEGVGWESREGGYQGAKIYSTREVLEAVEFYAVNARLQDDVENSFVDDLWCERGPYALSPSESLIIGWDYFCRLVKHETRFLFFPEAGMDSWDADAVPPAQILDKLGDMVRTARITCELPARSVIVRARCHPSSEGPSTAADLGPPHPAHARFANRMSPAGIVMFYGAFDEETAIVETPRASEDEAITIGVWDTTRALTLLDLTKIPPIPSIFDDEGRHLRPSILFFRHFVAALTKPIKKDGREHIEYVPSQIVTEYFRHRFTDHTERKLDGIIYPSSRMSGGNAIVIFCGAEAVGERGASERESLLVLTHHHLSARLAVQSGRQCVEADEVGIDPD